MIRALTSRIYKFIPDCWCWLFLLILYINVACIQEENTSFINTNHSNGEFLVTFDPLDGSSNIDSNITIGTIFGIFVEENIKSVPLGKSIVAAGYCLYGGSTQLIYTKKSNDNPIVEFLLLNQSSTQDLVLDVDSLALDMGDYSNEEIYSNNHDLSLKEARIEFEKEYLLSQIKRFSGNINKVSEFTGMERTALYRKLKSLNISVN